MKAVAKKDSFDQFWKVLFLFCSCHVEFKIFFLLCVIKVYPCERVSLKEPLRRFPPWWTELARKWVTWRIRPIRLNFFCLPAAGKFQLQQLNHCLHFLWILHWISRRSQVPMMQRAKQICLEPFTWSWIIFFFKLPKLKISTDVVKAVSRVSSLKFGM